MRANGGGWELGGGECGHSRGVAGARIHFCDAGASINSQSLSGNLPASPYGEEITPSSTDSQQYRIISHKYCIQIRVFDDEEWFRSIFSASTKREAVQNQVSGSRGYLECLSRLVFTHVLREDEGCRNLLLAYPK